MNHITAVVLSLATAICAQAPTVVTTTPSANGFLGPFEPIEVQFAAPIAPATVTPSSFSVFGRWTGVVNGTFSVDATQTIVRFQPDKPLFVGDAVQVCLSNAITSTSGTQMAGGYQFQLVVTTAPGSGVFQLTQTIPFRMPGESSISTYGIHGGDIDRDGSPDITAINENGHDLRIFKNDGCGNLGPMTVVSDGGNMPSPHESADFNRDGWMDLITGDYRFGNMSVFLNDGAGMYLPPTTLAGGGYLRSVGAGDFNGDGSPDVVAGNGAQTLVWLNDGTGSFLPSVPYTTNHGNACAELNVVDANEDGYLDIVMSSLTSRLWIMIGNGDGTFSNPFLWVPIGGRPFASASGDINGDGHVDIVYACQIPDSFRWMLGDGNGGYTAGGSLPTSAWPTSVHLGDLEGDGDLDAVLSHFTGNDFRVFLNDGAGNFTASTILPASGGGACTTLIDFDRDGDLDIIGADEITDVGMLFTQTGPVTTGLQPASCDATIRIDQRGAGDGFGGRPAVPVRRGNSAALSLSGPPGGIGAIALGFAGTTALPLQWGLMSFDPLFPIVVMNFAALDPYGEMMTAVPIPATALLGDVLLAQGLVFSQGLGLFTNPVQLVVVP